MLQISFQIYERRYHCLRPPLPGLQKRLRHRARQVDQTDQDNHDPSPGKSYYYIRPIWIDLY